MTIEKRAIGSSGLSVAPLALGGNVFAWTADETTSFAVLDAFVDSGGNMIDTADVYSAWAPGHTGGESERLIGRWLKRDPSKREKVVIATKVGFAEGLKPDVIARACDASLERLGVETIDIYYQHKDDESVPLVESLGAFEQLIEGGKIRAIGLSQFSADRVDEAMETARRCGLTAPSALQTWYNLVEREKFEPDLRDAALRHGLAVFPFYGLANGFLAGKYRSREDLGQSVRGERSADYLEGRGMRILTELDKIAAETGAAIATIALAWLVTQPSITSALASATALDQLKEIIAAMRLRLAADQIERLNLASAQVATA